MQLWQYRLLVTARLLYMFRTISASIIRSTKNCSSNHWCMTWVGMIYVYPVRMSADFGHPYSITFGVCAWPRTHIKRHAAALPQITSTILKKFIKILN